MFGRVLSRVLMLVLVQACGGKRLLTLGSPGVGGATIATPTPFGFAHALLQHDRVRDVPPPVARHLPRCGINRAAAGMHVTTRAGPLPFLSDHACEVRLLRSAELCNRFEPGFWVHAGVRWNGSQIPSRVLYGSFLSRSEDPRTSTGGEVPSALLCALRPRLHARHLHNARVQRHCRSRRGARAVRQATPPFLSRPGRRASCSCHTISSLQRGAVASAAW